MQLQKNIQKKLQELSDNKYRDFSSKLLPNTRNIIGVRLPILRKLAKDISKDNLQEYLKLTPLYFEEKLLQCFIIGQAKNDIEYVLGLVEKFIPKIDNWSVCDSFCNSLKITQKYKETVWNFLQKYANSKKEFEQRFAYVMFLNFFMDEQYLSKIFKLLNNFKSKKYYAQMSVAWLISVCYVKFPTQTNEFLQTTTLDKYTFNKSIQKIVESNRIDKKTKTYIKTLKKCNISS